MDTITRIDHGSLGPATSARLRRVALVALGWQGLAWSVAVTATSASWHAFGLGLVLPGAGFLGGPHPWVTALAVAAFAVAVVAWFIIGALVAPVVVWLGSALVAAVVASGPVDHTPDVAIALIMLVLAVLAVRATRGRGGERLEPLREARPAVSLVPAPNPAGALTDGDLGALRFLCDLALQPLDRFDGFGTIDQFREAAWRYQLTSAAWALAQYQAVHAPAFQGWIADAQANLAAKHADPRVWRYWRWEHLVGNLRWNPNPISTENVMLSGYLLLSLGFYASGTGDRRFDVPHSITFDDGRHQYPYDAPSIAAEVARQIGGSWICGYPCEPNWVYLFCNLVAMNGLAVHDRLHGTRLHADLEGRFHDSIEREFRSARGETVMVRSSRFGFAMPLRAVANDASIALHANPQAPDVAAAAWARVRARVQFDDAGFLTLAGAGVVDRLDPGSYRLTGATMRVFVMQGAREHGDEDIYAAAARTLDREAPPVTTAGATRWDASNFVNAMAALARFGGPGSFASMVREGPDAATRRGPYLQGAGYPEVLVERAVTDGADLGLVLRPGDGGGRRTLGIERLRPGATYTVKGGVESEVAADGRGHATVGVDLHGRTELTLAPI